jgi:acetyl esterase/lipase
MAISVVRKGQSPGGSAKASVETEGKTATAGNLLIVIASQTASLAQITFADNKGSTGWTNYAATKCENGTNSGWMGYKVAAGGETEIIATPGAGGTMQGLTYIEVSGLGAAPTIDAAAAKNNVASGKENTTTAITTTSAEELIFAGVCDTAASFNTISAWTGTVLSNVGTTTARCFGGYLVTSSTLTGAEATAHWETSRVNASLIFAFKVPSAAVSLAAVSGGGGAKATEQTTRVITLASVTGAGNATAINPASKGVQLAAVKGAGAANASVSTKRVLARASVTGGGAATATQPTYGAAQVYAYGEPSIWRVVEPLKATAPGSPVIIYLHESSKDEPSEVEAPSKLPRVGETLAETAANKRQLSAVGFAENAVENGFCCFVPAYHPISAGYPSANNDIDALIAWVKQHAEAWNGDPSKVCIIGGSFGVLYGFHEALRLNSEKGSRYIVAVAGLSGPIDIPSRVKGRNEEVAAKEAWEAAHPGFTAKELEEWEAEHDFATTDIVSKLANYLNVSGANLKELGWLEGPSAEQKAALKLAEELSPFYNLATMSATMPYLWYAVSKADLTPQQQGEEMNEAAAAHGQPGKYHFNASIPSGHSYAFYSSVRSEIYAYFRQAINPSTVAAASIQGGGSAKANVSTTRRVAQAIVSGAGNASATVPQTVRLALAQVHGGGSTRASTSTLRRVLNASVTGSGRVLASTGLTLEPHVHGGGRVSATAGPTKSAVITIASQPAALITIGSTTTAKIAIST